MATSSRIPVQGSPNQDKTLRVLTGGLVTNSPVNVVAPGAAPGLTGSTTGGALAAATYFYKVSAINANGESAASTEASVTTTGSTGSVALTWLAVANATGYKIYRGTVTNTENVYYLVSGGSTLAFTDIGGTTIAGTPLSANTTIVNITPIDYYTVLNAAPLTSATTINFGVGTSTTAPFFADEIQLFFTNSSGSSQTVTLGTGGVYTASTLVIANNKTGNITLQFNGANWCEVARSVTV